MFKVNIAEEFQLKQSKIGVLKEKDTVLLHVLPVKRDMPAARAAVRTTAEWEECNDRILCKGVVIVYSDYASRIDDKGNEIAVPGMKVGDGKTTIGELEFLAAGTVTDVMSEEEAREVLGTEMPIPDGPDGPGILTETEIETILNDSYDGDRDEPSGDPGGLAEYRMENVLTDDEILRILNEETEHMSDEEEGES